jgi:hypothetical protein
MNGAVFSKERLRRERSEWLCNLPLLPHLLIAMEEHEIHRSYFYILSFKEPCSETKHDLPF